MSRARRNWLTLLSFVAILAIAWMTLPASRRTVLRRAGWMLVASDPSEPADAVVIAVDADAAGTLEAADLIHAGVAQQVAIFTDPPDYTVANEFARRGVQYESGSRRSLRELEQLGVRNAYSISGYVQGTEDEGPALAHWCDQQHLKSVVVVTTPDHSRRLRRTLQRSMQGREIRVSVRAARYSLFDPDHWWESHAGVRIELEEAEKLLLDIVRHPFS